MRTNKYIVIAMLALTPAFLSAQTIQANQYVIWGIGDDQINIPAGSVITEAVLTIQNVAPQNTPLYIHLLDNTDKGLQIGTDAGSGDFFDSYGVVLSGAYENGNYVCRFSQVENAQSPIRSTFSAPTSITLADSTTVQLSSALLELMDYAGNGKGFGIGIDSGNNSNYSIGNIQLEVTLQSYTTQTASQSVVLTCNTNGLTAHWSMDDNTNSTTVIDSGGLGISGTAYQNTAQMATVGVLGGAFAFDGVSDYIRVSPQSAINQYGRTSFAVSAWIYPRSLGQGGEGRIVSKRGNGYDFYLTGTNQIGVYIPHISKTAWRISASNAVALNTWQHVAFVYNEDSDQAVKLYINGKLHSGGQNIAGQGSLADDRQNNLTIGRYSTSNTRQFDGYIDDVQIFNQSLSSVSLGVMYNEVITAGGPVAWWKLDDNANSATVVDSSGLGVTGTAYRNTDMLAATGVVGGAFGFDGVSDYIKVVPGEAINQYGRTSFAVSAWIYPRSMGQGGEGRIVCKRGYGYDFYLTGTNQVGVYIPHASKAAWRISTSNAIALNAWQHIAFVYNEDGDQAVKLYINGVLQSSGQNITGQGVLSDDRQNNLTIGRYSTSNTRQFDGFIDDVQIFSQSIANSRVDWLYQQVIAQQ